MELILLAALIISFMKKIYKKKCLIYILTKKKCQTSKILGLATNGIKLHWNRLEK